MVQVARRFPDEPEKTKKMSIITGDNDRAVHMSRLAIVGSHTVNGVSRFHSELLKTHVFNDFYMMFPERFQNVTNGITHRRWLLESNPGLSSLITEAIGDGWTINLDELRKLDSFVEDNSFCKRFREIKNDNKTRLLRFLERESNLSFTPHFMLDCQVKRFHEYKRQLLNIFHVITLYNRIIEGRIDVTYSPRVVMFSGKSAPGYMLCKLIIKLIHNVSEVV